MKLFALKQSTVGHNGIGLWAHPASRAREYRTMGYHLDLARLLENGGFDGVFFADVLGVLDLYGGSMDAALRDGVQVPEDDPLLAISAMAAVTSRLTFAVTASTSYEQPYTFARKMTTLDHLTNGRIGWNIVTSALESAARNLGYDALPPHDERYEVAEEFLEVTYQLWEASWADDAVVDDPVSRVYIDPSRVRPVRHFGKYFTVPDAALSEPSAQRTPVLFQAGTSGAGLAFAGRHAEGVFVSGYRPELVRKQVERVRDAAAAAGRSRRSVSCLAIVTVVTAPTDSEAAEKYAGMREYVSVEGALARYSAILNIDLAALDPDAPLTASLAGGGGIQGLVDMFTRLDATTTWTPRAIGQFVAIGGGGPVLVGSPATVVDQLVRWQRVADLDGFNVADPLPGVTLDDFAALIVPELRRRGLVDPPGAPRSFREVLTGAGPRVAADHPAASARL